MKRTFTYENAVIHIFIPDESHTNIQKATEKFMKKVMLEKEKKQNGYNNQSNNFRKK